jgi:hypothetical protein
MAIQIILAIVSHDALFRRFHCSTLNVGSARPFNELRRLPDRSHDAGHTSALNLHDGPESSMRSSGTLPQTRAIVCWQIDRESPSAATGRYRAKSKR